MTASSMHPADVGERPWHVSTCLVPVVDASAHVDVAAALVAADRPVRPQVRTTVEPDPLWRRVLSGRSFGWRLRRIRNRVRWLRRGVARRMLRWIHVHPELRNAAGSRTLVALALAAVFGRGRRSTTGGTRYRPPVVVPAALGLDVVRPSALVDDVDLIVDEQGPVVDEQPVGVIDSGDGLVGLRGFSGEVERVLAPVDLSRWNPSSFQRQSSGRTSIALASVAVGSEADRRRLADAQRAGAVVCDPEPSLAGSERARSIVELACAGVPLVGELTATDVGLIGTDLAAVVSGARLEDFADDRHRELYSLRLRRAALSNHSPRSWWSKAGDRIGVDVRTRPAVSVLLASNRPDDVVQAARSVARQVEVSVQLVVGLHGSHMPVGLEERIAQAFPGDVVVRRLGDDLNLGQVMNELTVDATCDLVSKWDDDDWYDVNHLADLVRALEYSGAGLVGKAAEFVHLERLDVTIRRFASSAERWSTTIAGGTMLMRRVELMETGWAEVPRQVDRRLIEALEARGLGIFRTHGFGYILRRRTGGTATHTWVAGDEYFLGQASDQRSGLDFEFAGFEVSS